MTADTLRADTATLRFLRGALDTHAADLSAVAATLRSTPSTGGALGPIGERFMSVFHASVAAHVDAVTAVSARVGTGAVSAGVTAADYDTAGQRAAALLPQV